MFFLHIKMRKIISKEQEAKKRKRNQLILAGILIIVMVGSTFGIIVNSFGQNEVNEAIEYNGYKFTNSNGFWVLNQGAYTFMFKYNPEQVEKISSELNYLNEYSSKPLYIFSEDYVAEVEIYRNLGQIVERFQGACLNETGCKENWPIKDCSNNFIIIKESEQNSITQEENCVFIKGRTENLTQLTDEFLFKILGIEK